MAMSWPRLHRVLCRWARSWQSPGTAVMSPPKRETRGVLSPGAGSEQDLLRLELPGIRHARWPISLLPCDTVQLPPCNWALSTRMGASHPSVHQIQMLAPYYTSAQLFFNLKG